ncbi:MAG TPA: glycosyltransferase family 9 protein [Fibrobacteria bacterium]|nr:glycosyltransferase family 9 protein [Fibrobacteria bacterium]
MATPALKLLSEGIGRENLGLLALKGSIRDMARGSGLFGEIFTWDPDKEGMLRGLGTLAAIRRSGYPRSLALFPTSHWKFSLFAALSGASWRAGFAYPLQKAPERLQSLSVPLDLNAHDTDQNIRLVEAFLGRPFQGPRRPFFPLAPKPFVSPAGDYYACHPGSSAERGMDEKRLPPSTYAALLRRIRDELGLKALLVGGPEEAPLRREILRLAPEAAFEAPAGSLEGAAGQIAGGRFFLGNDSGLMHMAAALGLPCAAFFGPTDERRTGPYGWWRSEPDAPRHLVLRKTGLGCAPCWTLRTLGRNPPCVHGDTRCLSAFEADEIWPRLRSFLDAALAQERAPA